MSVTIPWEEVEAELMKKPGFAEACEQARREIDEEIAKYGTIGNPKPTRRKRPALLSPSALSKQSPKRKSRGFSLNLKRVAA